MNTPAHLAASVLAWQNEKGWAAASAVALGAWLPDLPMFGFYGYQKFVVGSSEGEMWGRLYFDTNWQLFFDLFNSLPIFALIFAICWWARFRWGWLLAASALLHMVCDLPLHHDDGHRHFLPLSNWRFESPISYWDSNHFGHIFMWFELAFAVAASLYVVIRGREKPMRVLAMVTLGLYAAGVIFAIIVWGALSS